jgi:hypothetical protein
MAFLLMPPTATPAVELIRCTPPGKSLEQAICPNNLGLYAMAFKVEDLEALMTKVRASGHKILTGPVEMEIPVHGRIRAAVVSGPNQALLEFFESR